MLIVLLIANGLLRRFGDVGKLSFKFGRVTGKLPRAILELLPDPSIHFYQDAPSVGFSGTW